MLCVVNVVTSMVISVNIGMHNISFSFFHFHLLEFHFYPHSFDFFLILFFCKLSHVLRLQKFWNFS